MTDVTMYEYTLFDEWRARHIYGESLTDALRRAGKIQRPDKEATQAEYQSSGQPFVPGEWSVIARVISERANPQSRRGGRAYRTALAEMTDGRIETVDATEQPFGG